MAKVTGLDQILSHVGDFGKYQVITFTLILFITIFNCACHVAYVFTAMEAENRCFIPGCDGNLTTFNSDHVNYTIPLDKNGKYKKCEMFTLRDNSSGHFKCSADEFESDKISACKRFVFKDEGISIGKEYDLVCEENVWELSLVGTINTFGMMLGMWITGDLSDRYGRKAVLLYGMTLGGLVGLFKTFATRFEVFCILEFLEAFIESGCHDSVFILAMESVIPEHRFWTSCMFFSFCSSGQMLLAAVAWIVKDWRLIIYVTYGPCIFLIFLHPFILESIRWQLSKGDIERAKFTLNKIAKSNGKPIPPSYMYTLQKQVIENREKLENRHNMNLTQMLKSSVLLSRLMISIFLWISCTLLFYGLSLSSMHLAGNVYLNFSVVSFIEIPAYWLMLLVGAKVKRRILLIGSYLFTSVSCISFIFFGNEGPEWVLLILHCLGKFGATFAFNVLYTMTTEMFPTPLRHTTMGFCSMFGRIGSLISPHISLVVSNGFFWLPLPNVIFAATAGLAGILSFALPETFNLKLPDTIEEAEEIVKLNIPANELDGPENSCEYIEC